MLIAGRSCSEMTPVARDQLPEDERGRDREREDERLRERHPAPPRRGDDRGAARRELESPVAMRPPSEADAIRDLARRPLERRARARSTSSSSDTSERCTAMLIAATTSPVCARTGAAIERSPYASSSLLTASPRVAHALELALSSAAFAVIVFGPRCASSHPRQQRLQLVRRQEGEQHLAHRRAVRGQPRADVQVEVDLALLARASSGSARCRRCRRRRAPPCSRCGRSRR